jgi:uncharacterized protein with HEPN domain
MDNNKNISIIKHMVNYCNTISQYVERFGDSIDVFKADTAFKDASTMCILQIGELSTHLTDDFKQAYGEIPWKKVRAMRNIFAHNYEHMSYEKTWSTIQQDIPALRKFCEDVLRHYNILEQLAVVADYDESLESEDQFDNED